MIGAIIDTENDTQCKIAIWKIWQQAREWRFEPWFSVNVAELQGSWQYHEIWYFYLWTTYIPLSTS